MATSGKGGKEEPAEYYNEMFRTGGKNQVYFKAAEDYPHAAKIWKHIMECLGTNARILELGCGPGHFAELLVKKQHIYLRGIDFSEEAIRMARERTGFKDLFVCGDIFDLQHREGIEYNTVICTEVLEHVTNDIPLLQSLPISTEVFATVPTFLCKGHVRKFDNERDVINRYSHVGEVRMMRKFGRIFSFKVVIR